MVMTVGHTLTIIGTGLGIHPQTSWIHADKTVRLGTYHRVHDRGPSGQANA